jgi:HAMP domain-containing protein
MSLRFKLSLAFIALPLLAFAAIAGAAYTMVSRHAEAEVARDARRLLDAALAARDYNMGHVLPHLEPLLDRHFVPEAIPALAAAETLARLTAAAPGPAYREATVNAVNPHNAPVAWEREVVERLRASPDLEELSGEVDTERGRQVYLARPLRVTSTACLACHGAADAAPASMLKRYGRESGYGWTVGETVGAQIITTPSQMASDRTRQLFLPLAAALGAGLALLVGTVSALIHSSLVRPVRALARAADDLSQGDLSEPELAEDRSDEFGSLQRSINRMRRSLVKATALLRG